MKPEDFADISKRLNATLNFFDKWETKDQLKYLIAFEKFLTEIKPLVEKYDITDGFKLKVERLFGS